ncbi:hypothetical protein B0H03_11951 [Rathayibacter iranicus NCPPB 2253 = VKM Ac-1602]|nr:hypothetical protein B0H03_11951 [Rathayibacter iranicus NCPPB 2253 = VKM Ac-1602]
MAGAGRWRGSDGRLTLAAGTTPSRFRGVIRPRLVSARRRVLGMSLRSTSTTAFRFTKASAIDPNPATLVAKAGSALRTVVAGATFVTVREDGGLAHYFVSPEDGAVKQTAFGIAHAVSAHSEKADPPDLAAARVVGRLSFKRGSGIGVNTQAGAEITTVVDAIAGTLRDGEWVGMSVREPSRSERNWHATWRGARAASGVHHSVTTNSVVACMWVGAHDKDGARNLLRRVSSSLPGFDLRTKEPVLTATSSAAPFFLAAVFAAGAGFVANTLELDPWGGVAIGVGGVCAVVGGLILSGHVRSRLSWTRDYLATGLVPTPRRKLIRPTPPRAAGIDAKGQPVQATDGDYPLHSTAFLVGAILPLSIAAPHSGAQSGVASTRTRVAPASLRERIGPDIGVNDGQPVYLSTVDAWQGIICLGEAGSGKSALLQALWGYAALDKAHPSPVHGSVGANHTMISLDTKGDGISAREYAAWSDAADSRYVRFDVADRTSPIGIDLFPAEGRTVEAQARHIVAALKYVYGETSIGPESFDTLRRLLAAALVVTPDVASQVPGIAADASPFYYANVLLANRGIELGIELAVALREKMLRSKAEPGNDLYDAVEGLAPAYDPKVTQAQRSQLLKAPRTKVAALMAAETWWARPQKVAWSRLITEHHCVIINTGVAPSGDSMDDEIAAQMSSLIMYTLHESIKRHCVGWFEQGKVLSIYADELKQIAGTSADVVAWIRNDARSFGVRAVFATQYPEQLEQAVRDAVMGFGTLIAYAQSNPEIVATLVKRLIIDGSDWEPADVSGLPRYQAIVKTKVEQTAQGAFTVDIPNFGALRGPGFAARQGFTA